MLRCHVYGGYESTVIFEDELLTVRAPSAGIYLPCVKPFDEVEKGQLLGTIYDPLTSEVKAEVTAPDLGIVFFEKRDPLVMEHDSLFKIVKGLRK